MALAIGQAVGTTLSHRFGWSASTNMGQFVIDGSALLAASCWLNEGMLPLLQYWLSFKLNVKKS